METVGVRGRDYETLIAEASKTHADLIVIGTHRPSSLDAGHAGDDGRPRAASGRLAGAAGRDEARRAPTRSVLVAVDFSPASRRALASAISWFPTARITAVTAYGTARRSLLGEDAEVREAAAETRRLALKGFLDEIGEALGHDVEGALVAKVVPVVERGWAEDVILRVRRGDKARSHRRRHACARRAAARGSGQRRPMGADGGSVRRARRPAGA